jgi:hypothetical protein
MSAELRQALSDLGGNPDGSAPADQALLVRTRPAPRGVATLEASGSASAATVPSSPAPPSAVEGRARRRPHLAAVLGAMGFAAFVALGTWLGWPPARARTPVPTPSPTSSPLPVAQERPAPAPPATAAPVPEPTPLVLPPSPSAGAPPARATPPPATAPVAPESPASEVSVGTRLQRAEELVAGGRWTEALAEARAVLASEPRNARATALAQRAEEEQVIEECLRNARSALGEGDRERAEREVRRGFMIRKNDPRLLAMFREVMQQP